MNELNINKVVIGSTVRLDLTADTVTPDTLLEGVTAHDSTGSPITGEAKQKESAFAGGICYIALPAINDIRTGGTAA